MLEYLECNKQKKKQTKQTLEIFSSLFTLVLLLCWSVKYTVISFLQTRNLLFVLSAWSHSKLNHATSQNCSGKLPAQSCQILGDFICIYIFLHKSAQQVFSHIYHTILKQDICFLLIILTHKNESTKYLLHADFWGEIKAISLLFIKWKYISLKYIAMKYIQACTVECCIILPPHPHCPLKTKQNEKRLKYAKERQNFSQTKLICERFSSEEGSTTHLLCMSYYLLLSKSNFVANRPC